MGKNDPDFKPLARSENLLIRELPEELILFDQQTKLAHCLNKTAALVWNWCDGQTTVAQIATNISRQTPVSVEAIWLALQQLDKAHLLVEQLPVSTGISRRELARRVGLTALIAVPLVTSMISPYVAESATCKASGKTCATSAQCCSGICSGITCV
jgi:hypothetical protein